MRILQPASVAAVMDDSRCLINIPGYAHHGECNLICKPSDWKDILVFFLGNYGAHAATVIASPGQSSLTRAFSLILALFFPGAGVLAGINAIASLALFAPTELTRAVRAGALCIVVKAGERSNRAISDVEAGHECLDPETSPAPRQENTRPDNNDAIESADPSSQPSSVDQVLDEDISGAAKNPHLLLTKDQATLDGQPDKIFPSSIAASQVHGISRLPAGYRLLVLPKWTTFENDDDQGADSPETFLLLTGLGRRLSAYMSYPFKSQGRIDSTVPCSYNAIKALISIGQLLFSVLTLYETRGNQITVFGYAAFGLTVAPYFLMSLVNLCGNLMCLQYPNIFVVNSPTLDWLRSEVRDKKVAHRYTFDGTVGRISEETEAHVLRVNGHLLTYTTALEILFNQIDPEKSSQAWTLAYHAICAYVVSAVPIAIVGAASRFDAGQSAAYQRVWTMIWLCLGPMVGIGYGMWILPLFESRPVLWRTMMIRKTEQFPHDALVPGRERGTVDQDTLEKRSSDSRPPGDVATQRTHDAPRVVIWLQLARFAVAAVFISVYMTPAVGGFVVVGQMLMQYGTCNKLD